MKIKLWQVRIFLSLFVKGYKFTDVRKVDNPDCLFLLKRGRNKVWALLPFVENRQDPETELEIHFKFFNQKKPDAVMILDIQRDFEALLEKAKG
jgi:hypothetical protein